MNFWLSLESWNRRYWPFRLMLWEHEGQVWRPGWSSLDNSVPAPLQYFFCLPLWLFMLSSQTEPAEACRRDIGLSRILRNLHCFCLLDYTSWVYLFINKFTYLFSAALGLRCCAWAFSSCGERGLLFVWCVGFSLRWLLLLRSTGSRRMGFSSCGSWALERRLSSCGT